MRDLTDKKGPIEWILFVWLSRGLVAILCTCLILESSGAAIPMPVATIGMLSMLVISPLLILPLEGIWIQIPIIIIGITIWIGVWYTKPGGMRVALQSVGLWFLAYILCMSGLPHRLAFLASKAEFEEALELADGKRHSFNSRIGLFDISVGDSGRDGAYYFYSNFNHTILLTQFWCSEGFVYEPEAEVKTFSTAEAELVHVHGDWYRFFRQD